MGNLEVEVTMLQKSKIFQAFAIGAFAIVLLSSPFTSTAKADSNYRGHKQGHWVKKETRWNHGHRGHRYERDHFRHERARKHRRIRHNWKQARHHDYRRPHKTVRKVIYVNRDARHHRRREISDREFISSIIGALIGAQLGR